MTTDFKDISPPFVVAQAAVETLSSLIDSWSVSGILVRSVRGWACRDTDSLFSEFAAALEFPPYFGRNWPAFRECVSDLDWLTMDEGLIILIHNADQVLKNESPFELENLVGALKSAAHDFGSPVAEGEVWDRQAIPFHVVLQWHDQDDIGRWPGLHDEITRLSLGGSVG
jgi:hypothetical protein